MEAPIERKTPHLYQLRQAVQEFDESNGVATLYMRPQPRPCFTRQLLEDIHRFQRTVEDRVRGDIARHGESKLRYVVIASGLKDTYSLGGDLDLFVNCIRNRDRQGLTDYALACIGNAYRCATGSGLPITSIALIQGNAQGGGFEAALSCNVLIAERGTSLGFPEVLFNLFPGMGAYTFLSRRVNPALAERLIFSGELYSAEELHDMGVIDILAEPGQGKERLQRYIREAKRRTHALDILRHIRTHYNEVSYDELADVTHRWVDAALQLSESELRVMQRLVRAQDRKMTDDGPKAQNSAAGVDATVGTEPVSRCVQGAADIA